MAESLRVCFLCSLCVCRSFVVVEVAEMGVKMARWKNISITNEILPMILLFEKATDQ